MNWEIVVVSALVFLALALGVRSYRRMLRGKVCAGCVGSGCTSSGCHSLGCQGNYLFNNRNITKVKEFTKARKE